MRILRKSLITLQFKLTNNKCRLMRPKNKDDVIANTKAVLEGWEVEISCGPIPDGDRSKMEVSIESRTESDEHQSFRAPVGELIVGDKISKKVKVNLRLFVFQFKQ